MLKKFSFVFFIIIFSISLYSLIIKDIQFEGIKSFSHQFLSDKIISQIGDEFDQATANEDCQRILNVYENKSIFNTIIYNPVIEIDLDQQITLMFQIIEKEPVFLDSIQFSGNNYLSSSYLRNNLILDNPDLSNLDVVLENIGRIYNEKGFIFANIELDRIEKNEDKYIAYIEIEENKLVKVKEIKIRGNRVSTAKSILRISNLRNDTILTPEIINKAANNIERKEYIESCTIIPLNSDMFLIDLVEDKMTLLSGLLGYNNSNPDNKLSGFINLNFLNLFGSDRNLQFNWQNSINNKERIDFFYHDPGLDILPISGDFSIYREEQDSTYIETSFNSEIYYQLFQPFQQKFGFLFGLDRIYPGSRKTELVDNSSAYEAGFFWEFLDIDNYLNPKNGQNFSIKLYTQWRKLNNKQKRKQAIESSWKFYYPIFNNIIAHSSLNLKAFENRDITPYDYYELGGLRNLRGYIDDQFSGYRIGWINLEIRYLLSHDSRFFIFSDFGYVENLERKFGNLHSIGLGFRLKTRLGLLGIDYGFGKINGEFTNPLDGIIHFGIETKI